MVVIRGSGGFFRFLLVGGGGGGGAILWHEQVKWPSFQTSRPMLCINKTHGQTPREVEMQVQNVTLEESKHPIADSSCRTEQLNANFKRQHFKSEGEQSGPQITHGVRVCTENATQLAQACSVQWFVV